MKLLIVDDELMIREWLSHTISSLPFEISVLDTASNGIEALERTETELYDLIFIDINMPKMNGIDLLKRLYEKAIDSILIVLSSHDEFNFAREAIRYNIKEYLLKNECSKEKLTEILYSCQERLESESKEDELSQEILERVINGNIPAKVNSLVIRDFSALAGKIFFTAVVAEYPAQGRSMLENDQIRIVLEGKLGSFGNATFLIYSIESRDIKGRLNFDYSLLLAEAVGKTVSCGKLCREPKLILSECRNCWIGYQNLFYGNGNHCSGINQFRHFDSDSVNPLYEAIMSSIRSYGKDKTLEHLNALNSVFEQTRPTEKGRVINLYLSILDSYVIYNNLKSKNITNKLNAIRAKIGTFDNLDQLANWIIETIESDTGLIDKMKYSAPVESALEYIEAHFPSILNIQEIADHINLSLDYFSRLFKKEVGDSLNSYLVNYRLDKASIILLSTDLSVQEVAEKVGIENGSYFSKCFKKKFHTQPVHFRIQTNTERCDGRLGNDS